MLLTSINNALNELNHLLQQLSEKEYSNPCLELSNSTIGEHIRHIIEMFQCLENQYEKGIVNYDSRERNILIQTNPAYALQVIQQIQKRVGRPNKKIELQQIINGEEIRIESNYFRELLYNLEHCIHHQALIKVAVLRHETLIIDENFGVAPSTLAYRKQCVQ